MAAVAALGISVSFPSHDANAAEIKVISANGVRAVLADMKARYESASGNTLNITIVETGEIRKRVAAGEVFDVIIVPTNTSEDLVKQNKIVAGSAVPMARTGFGLAVRADGPKPDVSTADGLKKTLLAAKSVLITDPSTGGISGVHFISVLDKLGIAEAMAGKLVLNRGSGYHAERIAKGEADLAVQAEHEIRCVPGVAFLAYPTEFQRPTVFAAGVSANAPNADAARAYIQLITGAEAAPVIKAKCLQPGS